MKKNLFLWGTLVTVAVILIAFVLLFPAGQKLPSIVKGKVTIKESLIPDARGIRRLFVVLYDADSERPMPYGAITFSIKPVESATVRPFNLNFENLNVMNKSIPIPKNFRIKARLDVDGIAGPDKLGDLVGESSPVAFGSDNVQVKITQRVK